MKLNVKGKYVSVKESSLPEEISFSFDWGDTYCYFDSDNNYYLRGNLEFDNLTKEEARELLEWFRNEILDNYEEENCDE